MRFKILGILAAVVLLGACESTSENSVSTSGEGDVNNAKPVETQSSPQGNGGGAMNAPGSQEELEEKVGARVYFGFDRFSLDSKARNNLDQQAAWLKANPGVSIEVEGHCDERGTREYNIGLGWRRANAVKDYLVALGVNPSRVKTNSYGKERPRALGSNEAAWAQNRRTETVVRSAGS